jgi:hypothetical protein
VVVMCKVGSKAVVVVMCKVGSKAVAVVMFKVCRLLRLLQ